ncbi:MAG: putative Ig domain-containing protein [Myxococcota bacterium]
MRPSIALAPLIALGFSAPVQAQPTPPEFVTVVSSRPYQSLTERGLTVTQRISEGLLSTADVTIPFPYDFLDLRDAQELRINPAGYVAFESGNITFRDIFNPQDVFPNSLVPNYVVAPYWAILQSVRVVTASEGTSPNRVFYVEFEDFTTLTPSSPVEEGSFTIAFFEVDRSFEVSYGGALSPPSFPRNAMMGYEGDGNATGDFEFFTGCASSGTCGSDDFDAVADQVFRVQPLVEPELRVTAIVPGPSALPGNTTTATLTIENRALETAPGVDVALYASTDDSFDEFGDDLIGVFTDVADIDRGETNVAIQLTIPANLPLDEEFYLIAILDPDDEFEEIFEADNIEVTPVPTLLTGFDLEVTSCTFSSGPSPVLPGSDVVFDVGVRNRGVPVTQSIEVALYASEDQRLETNQDVFLGNAATGALPNRVEYILQVPGRVPDVRIDAGLYFPICVLDPANLIPEVLLADQNVGIARTQERFFIAAPPIVLTDDALPPGQFGMPYDHLIGFTGGSSDDRVDFNFNAIGLPDGLSVDGEGRIVGTPVREGEFSVEVTVDDGADSASRVYDLQIAALDPLVIQDPELGTRQLGDVLDVLLVVSGGLGDLSFELFGGRLPNNLIVTPAGRIIGRLEESGNFEFTVRVEESPVMGASPRLTTIDLTLVVEDSPFDITSDTLDLAIAGEAFEADIGQSGGVSPVNFVVNSGTLPSGLMLEVEGDQGVLRGTPATAQTANFGIVAVDAIGRTRTAAFQLQVLPSEPNCPSQVDPRCEDVPEPMDEPELAPAGDSGGCQGANGQVLWPLLVVGLLALIPWRRARAAPVWQRAQR